MSLELSWEFESIILNYNNFVHFADFFIQILLHVHVLFLVK